MEERRHEETPKDRYRAVYLLLLLHGIGLLMPWNMFITANSYFVDYKMSKNYTGEESEYATYFLQSVGFAAHIPNVIFNWINVFINIRGSITPRIVLTLCIELAMFIVTIILAVTNTSGSASCFFWGTMVIIVIINMSNGVYQNTIFGIASKLPSEYPGAVILGCNISGMLISFIDLLTIIGAPNIKFAAIYYFLTGTFVLSVCLVTYFVFLQIRFYRTYVNTASENARQRTPYLYIFKQAFSQLLNVYFVFFITLAIFPALQANIQKSDSNFIIPEKYYSQVMCFITFNTAAMVGCLITNWINWPSPRLLIIPVALRALFIPFFFFCNYQPTNKVRKMPVLIKNDWIYWIAGIGMAFTSGYFSTKAMIYTTGSVEAPYMSVSGMYGAAVLVTGVFSGVLLSMIYPPLAEI